MHVTPEIDNLLAALNDPTMPPIYLGHERIRSLLAALGHPEKKLPPTILVAGTNGKGSTIAFLRNVYRKAGYKVHVYTSPHLVSFNERIVIDDAPIADAALAGYLRQVVEAAKQHPVTFFEATTAAAFLAFADHPADILLLEVGLGGRKDATNVTENLVVSVITPVDIDHREFLGDTHAAIAAEKAGIIRDGVPVVVAPQVPGAMEVLLKKAPGLHLAAPYSWSIGLAGEHQKVNAGVAATVVELLQPQFPVDVADLCDGIEQATWPGRLQRLTNGPLVEAWGARGEVVLDGGHNAHAAGALAAWAAGQAKVVLIAGLMQRKDAVEFLTPLSRVIRDAAFIGIPGHEDSHPAEHLAAVAHGLGMRVHACVTLEEAAGALAPVGKATLLVAGSLFLVGEVLKNHG
jgi:dihydrofolate synthase/folylpolyglutamate synthase